MFKTQTLLAALVAIASFSVAALSFETTPVDQPTESLVKPQLIQKRQNIVLIVADDHGQDAGSYGNPVIKTPNIDALATDGVRFPYAFATTASCSASRSVILSGLHNHRTGQYGHTHDFHHFQSYGNIKGLPVLLGESGYRTGLVGKYHVAPSAVYEFGKYIPGYSRNNVLMANNAEEFVKEKSDKPFFLYYATADPHRSGNYANDQAGKPDRFGNNPDGFEGVEAVTYDPEDVIVPPFLPDTVESRAELAQYYESVTRLDQGVGRLIEILKEAGVYKDTLIIYISDHGIAFPGAKTTVYEPGLLIPMIVRHPDSSYGRNLVNEAMVSLVDIVPTILDFANVEEPTYKQNIGLEPIRKDMPEEHGLHGRSILPVLNSQHPEGWDEIFASHTFHEIQMYYPMRVVRDREYKLIWNIAHQLPYPFAADLWESPTWQGVYQQGPGTMYGQRTVDEYINRPKFELYNVQADANETDNLAAKKEYADVLEEYIEKLKGHQKRTSDPWFLKWTYE